jgi:hypothetical protein
MLLIWSLYLNMMYSIKVLMIPVWYWPLNILVMLSDCISWENRVICVVLAAFEQWEILLSCHTCCDKGLSFLLCNINWLIFHYFTFPLRNFHSYGDVTIAGEGLQNLGLCSALRAFEQGGIFIVPHLLWYRDSVFPVSSEAGRTTSLSRL